MDNYNYKSIIVAMWNNTWQSNNNIVKKMCIEKGRNIMKKIIKCYKKWSVISIGDWLSEEEEKWEKIIEKK